MPGRCEEKWKLGENSGLALVADRNYFASSTLRVGQPRIDAPIAYSMATTPGDGAGWIVTAPTGMRGFSKRASQVRFHWGTGEMTLRRWRSLAARTGRC